MNYIIISNGELYHHGVKGMHWGVRRYQNKDGSLTSAGRKRYTDYKPAIKEYRDSYDKASSMNDAADAKWRDVQAARKELGRTAIGRTIASARNKTEAAKKYNRMYDEWSKMQDDADEQWRDADEKYKHTGGNRLTRIANNIRYDTKLGSAKSGEKKQLTDEERAARNAKIKKAAVAVGAVAATAALAYVGHKYVNKKMDAAEKMVADIGQKNVDRAFSQWQVLNDNSMITKSRGDKLYDEGRKAEAKAYWDAARESKETAKRQMERYSNLYDSYNKAVGDRKTNALVALATAKRDRALRELDKSGKSVSRDQLDAIIAQYEHDVMDAIKKAK